MKVLLEQEELSFLDITKEQTSEYSQNSLINKMLMICTKNKMKRNNFVNDFNKFSLCVRKKMLKLVGEDTYGMTDSLFAQKETTVTVPEIIDKSQIAKAMLKGFLFLEPIMNRIAKENGMDLENYDHLKELAFVCTLLIIARANIEFKFTN